MARMPKYAIAFVAEAARWGHKLVSQGCGLFVCTACSRKWWIDESSGFREECPKLRQCPHCERAKEPYNTTCTRSECQQISAQVNAALNAAKRRA